MLKLGSKRGQQFRAFLSVLILTSCRGEMLDDRTLSSQQGGFQIISYSSSADDECENPNGGCRHIRLSLVLSDREKNLLPNQSFNFELRHPELLSAAKGSVTLSDSSQFELDFNVAYDPEIPPKVYEIMLLLNSPILGDGALALSLSPHKLPPLTKCSAVQLDAKAQTHEPAENIVIHSVDHYSMEPDPLESHKYTASLRLLLANSEGVPLSKRRFSYRLNGTRFTEGSPRVVGQEGSVVTNADGIVDLKITIYTAPYANGITARVGIEIFSPSHKQISQGKGCLAFNFEDIRYAPFVRLCEDPTQAATPVQGIQELRLDDLIPVNEWLNSSVEVDENLDLKIRSTIFPEGTLALSRLVYGEPEWRSLSQSPVKIQVFALVENTSPPELMAEWTRVGLTDSRGVWRLEPLHFSWPLRHLESERLIIVYAIEASSFLHIPRTFFLQRHSRVLQKLSHAEAEKLVGARLVNFNESPPSTKPEPASFKEILTKTYPQAKILDPEELLTLQNKLPLYKDSSKNLMEWFKSIDAAGRKSLIDALLPPPSQSSFETFLIQRFTRIEKSQLLEERERLHKNVSLGIRENRMRLEFEGEAQTALLLIRQGSVSVILFENVSQPAKAIQTWRHIYSEPSADQKKEIDIVLRNSSDELPDLKNVDLIRSNLLIERMELPKK